MRIPLQILLAAGGLSLCLAPGCRSLEAKLPRFSWRTNRQSQINKQEDVVEAAQQAERSHAPRPEKQERETETVRLTAFDPPPAPASEMTLATDEPDSDVPVLPESGSGFTLSQIEQLALGHNPAILQAAASAQKVAGFREQVGQKPNPTVGYSGQQLADQGTDQHLAFVQQQFVSADKLELNQRVLDHEMQSQLWEVETQRYRVLTDVRLKFYEALAAQRRRRLASEFHSVAEKGVEVAKLRRKALEGSVPEILQSEIQLSEVDLIQRQSDIAYRAAWKEMASVAGLPHLQMQPLLGELRVDAPHRDWEMTYAQLRASSPAIQAAQARAGRAAAMLERQEVQPIPNLLASMAAGVDNGANSGMLNVQVGIPLPIFNKNSGNISAAYSEYCRASQEVQRLELKLRQDLAAAAGEYDSAVITCQQYENRILPRAQQTLDLSEQAYEAGEFDFLRVLVARRTFYETNLEYNTALLNLARAYWRIEGILLEGGLDQTPDTSLGDGLRGQSLSGE